MKASRIYSREGQEVIMVVYALSQLRRICTKQEVLRFIREQRLYAIQPEDTQSYESKNEWKSDTLLCWGRKHAVMDSLGWMFHHDEKDCWDITRDGLSELEDIFKRFRAKRLAIQKCFMWSPEFKVIVDPSYVASARDTPRLKTARQRMIWEAIIED